MARLLIQSGLTFQFLHASPIDGGVAWTPSLLTALRFGLIHDEEELAQLIEDHCDKGMALVVDLDADFDD